MRNPPWAILLSQHGRNCGVCFSREFLVRVMGMSTCSQALCLSYSVCLSGVPFLLGTAASIHPSPYQDSRLRNLFVFPYKLQTYLMDGIMNPVSLTSYRPPGPPLLSIHCLIRQVPHKCCCFCPWMDRWAVPILNWLCRVPNVFLAPLRLAAAIWSRFWTQKMESCLTDCKLRSRNGWLRSLPPQDSGSQEAGLLFPSGMDALRTAYLPNQFKPFPLRPLILFPQLRGNRMLVTLSRSHWKMLSPCTQNNAHLFPCKRMTKKKFNFHLYLFIFLWYFFMSCSVVRRRTGFFFFFFNCSCCWLHPTDFQHHNLRRLASLCLLAILPAHYGP